MASWRETSTLPPKHARKSRTVRVAPQVKGAQQLHRLRRMQAASNGQRPRVPATVSPAAVCESALKPSARAAGAAHLPHGTTPCSCTAKTEPQPPKRSLAQPKTTRRSRSSDSAAAHMMHGSQVTYSSALRVRWVSCATEREACATHRSKPAAAVSPLCSASSVSIASSSAWRVACAGNEQ